MLFLAPLLLSGTPCAVAQEPAPAAAHPERPVAEAWQDYRAAAAAMEQARDARHREALKAARLAFRDAFEATPRESWDGMEPEMLGEGLHLMAEHVLEHDAEMAAKAWEELLERCPDDARVSQVRTRYLPNAYLALGHPETSRERLQALWAATPAAEQPAVRRFLGDAHAMEGDLDAAVAEYRAARDAIPEEQAERGPLRSAVRALDLRLRLVGEPMPALHVQERIAGARTRGAGPDLREDLRGEGVLLLDFWATWCGPCRTVMPHLDALAHSHRARGLRVVGVTRPYDTGFLPHDATDLHAGERVTDIEPEAFADHLRAFRDRAGLSYPFVVVPAADVEEAYGVTAIPTLVLVGRDGRVRFVKVGAGDHGVLDAAVRLALAD